MSRVSVYKDHEGILLPFFNPQCCYFATSSHGVVQQDSTKASSSRIHDNDASVSGSADSISVPIPCI